MAWERGYFTLKLNVNHTHLEDITSMQLGLCILNCSNLLSLHCGRVVISTIQIQDIGFQTLWDNFTAPSNFLH